MENNPQFGAKYHNTGKFSEKKNFQNILEEHSLSLRKKKNNRHKQFELPPELISDSYYKIDISELEKKICNNQVYLQFKVCSNEKEILGILFQMLLIDNDDIILFSVAKIRDFLVNTNENIFHEKNYDDEFNDKLIKFLFELLLKKSDNLLLLSNICFLLTKLSSFQNKKYEKNYFFTIYPEYFGHILTLANNISINEPKAKNLLYILANKIFLCSDDMISQLENKFPNYALQIHSELKNLDENKFVKNMPLISTLLKTINDCFFSEIYSNYFFTNINNKTDELNAVNIIKFIQRLINYSYQEDIFEQELRCIQNFFYFFMDKENLFQDKNLKNKIRNLIYDLELEKKIVPMIYDNTINNEGLRNIAIQILINAMYICPKKLCETFIENDISKQITKLEQYLISQTQFKKKIKDLYILLLDLIFNLIENESSYIIYNLSIENNCISLLFKLQKIPFYAQEIKYIIKIFNVLISSNHKYIQTLLVSEGICEFYKGILGNEPNSEDIETIINNLISMVNYSDNFADGKIGEKENINLILMHLEKIGVYEVINNLKSRNDLSDAAISSINEISSLFNHK